MEMERKWAFTEDVTICKVNRCDEGKYYLRNPIVITLCWDREDESFVAIHTDSGVASSGEVKTEAIFNCMDMLTGSFELLRNKKDDELGPAMRRQRDALQNILINVDAE